MPTRTRTAPVHGGRVDSPFFRSKFRAPAAPQHFLHRARLTALLDDLEMLASLCPGSAPEALRRLSAVSMSRRDAGSGPDAFVRILERIPPEVSGADVGQQYRGCERTRGAGQAGAP